MNSKKPDPIDLLKSTFSAEKDCVWIALIYGTFVGFLSLVVPIGVQALVNSVAFGSLLQPLIVMTVLVFAALCVSGVLQLLQLYAVELLQCRIFARTALKAADMLLTDDLESRTGGRPQTSVSRFLEVSSLQKNAATLIIDGISLALQIGIGLLLLAFYHPYLLAFDIILVGALLAIVKLLGKNAVSTSIKESAEKYNVLESLEVIQRCPLSFRSFKASRFALQGVDSNVLQFLRARRRHFTVLFKQATATFALQALASALLLGVGGWLVIHNQLTLGQLVAAELVLTGVLTSLAKLPKYFESFYDLVASADKTAHLLDAPREREIGTGLMPQEALGKASPLIAIRDLHYERSASGPSLSVPRLDIPRGESTALYGPTGSGKSTLFDLIIRVKHPGRGHVDLAGLDTRDLRLEELRTHVMLLRERAFIDGNVSDNVALWQADDADQKRLRSAIEQAGLVNRITAFPHGLSTRLSAAGAPLDGVEQVRLLLARAIFLQPPLILVDELFDPFDDETRGALTKSLLGGCSGSTVVVATERADVAGLCSRQITISREGQAWLIKA